MLTTNHDAATAFNTINTFKKQNSNQHSKKTQTQYFKHTLTRCFIFCSLFFCALQLFAQSSDKTDKLNIVIHKNIELLGLAYFVGFEGVDIEHKTVEVDGKTLAKKDWHNYGYKIYQQYQSYANSKNLTDCFTVADHLWLDYLTAFLLQVEDVPNARLTDEIPESYYVNFSKTKDIEEAKTNATIFLNGLNAFAEEIQFENYLSSSKIYYNKAIEEIKTNLPDSNFIYAMEAFYKQTFKAYLLIPSLTIPKGMAFGIKNTTKNTTAIINVFGALDVQDFSNTTHLNMGFANQNKIRELSVHEFGHSFVNPVVATIPAQYFTDTAHLFIPLQSAMSDQGYTTWKACVFEHFVRAGELIIAEKTSETETFNTLFNDYQNTRQFKYLPKVLAELKKYDTGIYPTYYETVIQTMMTLKQLK